MTKTKKFKRRLSLMLEHHLTPELENRIIEQEINEELIGNGASSNGNEYENNVCVGVQFFKDNFFKNNFKEENFALEKTKVHNRRQVKTFYRKKTFLHL